VLNIVNLSISRGAANAIVAMFCAASLCAFAPHALAQTTQVTVFAAASMRDSLDEVVRAFNAKTKTQIRVSYAASNALANQIANGAPAQIFVSADQPWMDWLAEKNAIDRASRRDLVGNELVIVAPSKSNVALRVEPGFALAAALGSERLAIANPQSVPAGRYAKEALQALGVWQSVASKLAPSESVRAALAFVARGEAPLGIVYRTDALVEPKVRIVASIPANTHSPIRYPVALTNNGVTADARAFYDFLFSAEADAVWRKFGFQP
jgi:molybdate transport system substrate-binding protein